MNKLYHILILAICFPILLSATGHRSPIIMRGVVMDANGAVISNAGISLERNGQVLHTVTSEEDGSFELRYEGDFIRSDQLKVKVQKAGYRTRVYKPLGNKTPELNVKLEKKPEFRPMLLPSSAGHHNII